MDAVSYLKIWKIGNAFIMASQSVDSIYVLNLVTENSITEVAFR